MISVSCIINICHIFPVAVVVGVVSFQKQTSSLMRFHVYARVAIKNVSLFVYFFSTKLLRNKILE